MFGSTLARDFVRILGATAAMAFAVGANAATFTTYDDGPDFVTALIGAPVGTVHVQDFEGFAPGTDLEGVELVTGVTATSNLDAIVAFSTSGEIALFAFSDVDPNERVDGNVFVAFQVATPMLAFGLSIISWNPDSEGAAVARVAFLDGTSVDLDRFPTNATENDDSFFGIIADSPITSVTWFENFEPGSLGNEEVAFGGLIAAEVPEPATALLVAVGLSALVRRRPRV